MTNRHSKLNSAGLIAFLAVAGLMTPGFIRPLWGTEARPPATNDGAALAFARYSARQETAEAWRTETIEIEASLPKLAKKGRLKAIRRLLPLGRPEYSVLETGGDKTVQQQVIVRYLRADVHAFEIPADSVAITPANYKFNYKGAMTDGGRLAYAFQITPRRKREGLIKGELWLDGDTGAPIRESGYLVKGPSVFVKRVEITRETSVRDGVGAMRVTHLSVTTRLVGRAELVIEERPFGSSEGTGPAEGQ